MVWFWFLHYLRELEKLLFEALCRFEFVQVAPLEQAVGKQLRSIFIPGFILVLFCFRWENGERENVFEKVRVGAEGKCDACLVLLTRPFSCRSSPPSQVYLSYFGSVGVLICCALGPEPALAFPTLLY